MPFSPPRTAAPGRTGRASAAEVPVAPGAPAPLRLLPPVLPALLGVSIAALIALQIAWPLAHDDARARLTVAIVLVFAIACLLHVTVSRGVRTAMLVLLVTALPGFAIEVLGVHTSVPFGAYSYSAELGPRLLGVPVVVALAWTMTTWPAAVVARRLAATRRSRIVLGAWAATAGDLFLDPQLVAIGGWTWRDTTPHLPGVPDVPLSNFGGWLVATLVLSALLQFVMGDSRREAAGLGLYLWSWVSWTMALAVFLDQPAAAGWGFAAMATVAVPLTISVAGPRLARAVHR